MECKIEKVRRMCLQGGKMEGGLWLGNQEGDYLKSNKINYYETFDNQQTPSRQHEHLGLPGFSEIVRQQPGESENSCHQYRQLLVGVYKICYVSVIVKNEGTKYSLT